MRCPKISVIVPVYNAERYIRQCLDSILTQDFADFELMIVDDGSTDSSLELCKDYSEKDSRIRLFHKENAGPSSARNFALTRANGEYLLFLDSDDYWLDNSCLGRLYQIALDNNLDIVRGELKQVDEKGDDFGITSNLDSRMNIAWKVLSSGEFYRDAIRGQNFLFLSLFRKSVVCNYRFDENLKFFEDGEFYARVLLSNLRCMYVPICFYAYRVNPFSITNSGNVKNLQDSFLIGEIFAEYTVQAEDEIIAKEYAFNSVMMYYWTLASIINEPYYTDRKRIIKDLNIEKYRKSSLRRAFTYRIINKSLPILCLPPSVSVQCFKVYSRVLAYIRNGFNNSTNI